MKPRRPPKGFSCWRIGMECDWNRLALKKEIQTERLLVGGPWVKCKRCGFARRMTPEEIDQNVKRGLAMGSALSRTMPRRADGRYLNKP